MLTSQLIETPVGTMTAIAGDRGLVLFEFSGPRRLPGQLARVRTLFGQTPEPGEHTFLAQTRVELDEYFAGRRKEFRIPLVIAGTPFQESVWRELLRIPFGTTVSYHQIATRIGRPGSSRAVGRANGDNRIAIIIPCHRVIGSNGSLTGYGGGEPNKRWLLDHEATDRHPRERSDQGSAFQMSLPVFDAGETV
jgi:AraC family transcriptional regulator of adaptative response/methylated-DNA-[protein]-cysteine methyltransferase